MANHSLLKFSIVFLIVLLFATSCNSALGNPVPSATLPPTIVPTPTLSLVDLAGNVCKGEVIDGAAQFSDSPEANYKIFVARMDGAPHSWNKDLPEYLRAQNIADLDAVLCLDDQQADASTAFDCGQYKAVNGDVFNLQRNKYLLHARLISANNGQTLFDYQAFGQMPECPETVDTSDSHVIDSVLYGEDITLKDIIDQQLPYFIPETALTPMWPGKERTGSNWYDGSLVAVSPDKRLVVSEPISLSDQPTLQLWDVKTQSPTFTLKGHSPEIVQVTNAVFSPDGRYLASSGGGIGTGSGELFVWDTQSGERLYSLLNPTDQTGRPEHLTFTPDGKTLAAITADDITFWDVAGGQVTKKIHLDARGVVFVLSPDGMSLFSMDTDGNAWIRDAGTGEVKADLGPQSFSAIWSFTSDGRLLKAVEFLQEAGETQFSLLVFDAQTGNLVNQTQPSKLPQEASTYTAYYFDADHDVLIRNHYLNRDGSLRIYDLTEGNMAFELFASDGVLVPGTVEGRFLPIVHWDGEYYLLDINWLYHLLPAD